jgi:hypothetical protein
MDVAWFLNRRLDFIRQLYARSSAPFVDRRTKIENEEEPFVPPYSEDPEPAFMLEWQEASDSIDVLGHACLCMLAPALQAYPSSVHPKTSPRSVICAGAPFGALRRRATLNRCAHALIVQGETTDRR